MPPIIAVILGVVTAVFGGVLRDIVCNEIPRAFSDHRPYAICAFAGGWTLVALHTGGLPASLSLLAAAAGRRTGVELAAAALASLVRRGPQGAVRGLSTMVS